MLYAERNTLPGSSTLFLTSLLELSLPVFLVALLVTLLAGIVRGYAGFGFSAIVVAVLSQFLPPSEVVPIVLFLEIAASVHMFPSVWHLIDRRALLYLMLGSFFSLPAGVLLLANLDENLMRLLIALLILIASLMIAMGFRIAAAGDKMNLATGVVSGAMTGAAGVGGLAIVTMFLSSAANMAVARATLVAVFFISDSYAIAVGTWQGLIDLPVIYRSAILVLPLALGVNIGSRLFHRSNHDAARKFAVKLLIVLSLLTLTRAIVGMF